VESDQIVSMSSKKRDARERRRDVKKIERSSETTSALNSVFFFVGSTKMRIRTHDYEIA
jgi:hypothetical protein